MKLPFFSLSFQSSLSKNKEHFLGLVSQAWKKPEGYLEWKHRRGTSNFLHVLDCQQHWGKTPSSFLPHMFSLLVHLHCAALLAALSTSFCHFCSPPPLAQAPEPTPQRPPRGSRQPRRIPFPQVVPPLTNVHQHSYIIPKLVQMN